VKESKPLVVFGDFDSLAYQAGRAETETDMQQVVNNKMSLLIKRCQTKLVIGWVEVCHNKQNFRNHVATTRIYKGNRAKKAKPHLLNEAKEYMVGAGYARWCNYIESEDRMLIEAKRYGIEHTIKAFIDKDCRQQWGRVYDYKKDTLYHITPDEAHYNLFHQFLTGDISTDNIVGVWKYGETSATKLLSATEPDDYPLAVAKVYAERDYSYDYMLEQCRLLYLLRTDGDVFHYPLTRDEYEVLL